MARLTRRKFLKQSLAVAGATFAVSTSARRVLGANERLNVGVAGIRGRGGGHMGEYLRMPDVEVTWLIDIDRRVFPGRVSRVEQHVVQQLMKEKGVKEIRVPKNLPAEEKKKKSAERAAQQAEFKKLAAARLPKTVQDVRKALEDKDLHAISIATPNHWHALMTIWACQAGKDVYVEKPCSHNVFEGRKAVEAARKYKRIVQHGTQSRSGDYGARMAAYARTGKLGKLLVSHGFSSKPRGSIKFKEPKPPPPEVDFNLWLGPAQKQPYHENLVHYNWHWFWDFGSGEIGNQGVHQMDLARWGIPDATLPKAVVSVGGRWGYKDQGQTPNTQFTLFDYGETVLIFEVCGLVDSKTRRVSNDFHFEAGSFIGGRFTPKDKGQKVEMPKVTTKRGPGGGHFGNFIAAVRSRKVEDLNADILEGHYSAALCHLGNISYRLGTDGAVKDAAKALGDHAYAQEAWAKLLTHLRENRKLELDKLTCRIGRPLKFDAENEKFIGDAEADKLLTRDYRPPFVVPEEV